MITFQRICLMLCVGLGFSYNSSDISASEPSIYSKILTPSPLGKDRILALCLPGDGDTEAVAQFYNGVNWNAFSERHLTIIEISQHVVQSVSFENGADEGVFKRVRHHDFSNQIRKKADCKIKLDFTLIGKDMGVKNRWEGAIAQDELFELIDAMPMRRFEMRQKLEKN